MGVLLLRVYKEEYNGTFSLPLSLTVLSYTT